MRSSTVPQQAHPVGANLSIYEAPSEQSSHAAAQSLGRRVVTSDSGLLPLFPFHEDSEQELKLAAETQEWWVFLSSLVREDISLGPATRSARVLWAAIRERHPRVTTLPVTSLTDDVLQLAWRSQDGKYIEVEVSRDGRYEWLYRDSRGNRTEYEDLSVALSSDFFHFLTRLFVA